MTAVSRPERSTPRGVRLWLWHLDALESDLVRLGSLLSPAERARAASMGSATLRRRYVLAHAGLRILLGRACGVRPADVRVRSDPCRRCGADHGKPRLVDAPWEFNLAHSGEYALAAVAPRPVGVDIERVRTRYPIDDVSRRFFAPSERDLLARVPPGRRHRPFFSCWTQKEAVVKATGEGLTRDLDSFSVVPVGRPVELEPGRRWRVQPVSSPPGYVAALAAEGGCWSLVAPAAGAPLEPDRLHLGRLP
jgi:4'-phosphopantetheinyl transferase